MAGTGRKRRHPVVATLMKTRRLEEALDAVPADSEPAVAALQVARRARRKEISWDQAVETLGKIDIETVADLELRLLFCLVWAESSYYATRLTEMEALINRARLLVVEDTPPNLRQWLAVEEGLLASGRGDKARRLQLLEQDHARQPKGSLERLEALLMRALFVAQLGRLAEIEAELEEVGPDAQRRYRAEAELIRFVGCLEAGRTEEAAHFLERFREFPQAQERRKHFTEGYVELLGMLQGKWNFSRPSPARDSSGDAALPDWAKTIDLLAEGKCDAALVEARRDAAENPERNLSGLGINSFDLLRAELAKGNAPAARRILDLRRERGNAHYLEDFFAARAELLDGNRETAGRCFGAAVASCERYRARARLDFELSLAHELRPPELVWLGQCSAKKGARSAAVSGVRGPLAELQGIDRLVGRSKALAEVRDRILSFAAHAAPVLITGETGTGKELVARALHESGPRAKEPFLAVNCGAIADSLLESEIFGHERGAFTGASRAHRGLFEQAGKGTLVLDEIGDVSPRLQVALLRLLETGEVRPVGAVRMRRIKCRVVAATNASLEKKCAEGAFRQDLLFRLKRLEIHIPPLRERREDIVPLAGLFMSQGRRDGLRPAMNEELKKELEARPWPGNVRELCNEIERMRLLNSEKLSYGLEDLIGRAESVRRDAGESAGTRTGAAEAGAEKPAAGRADADVAEFLKGRKSQLRRLDRVRELFRAHGRLTRVELAEILGVSKYTAGRDLRALISEGFVEKVEPNRSPRSHYFRLRAGG